MGNQVFDYDDSLKAYMIDDTQFTQGQIKKAKIRKMAAEQFKNQDVLVHVDPAGPGSLKTLTAQQAAEFILDRKAREATKDEKAKYDAEQEVAKQQVEKEIAKNDLGHALEKFRG